MAWTFETCLAAFLVVAFASQAIAAATRSRISLQLALGALCALGLAAGLLPADFAEKSKMTEVGVIAFNVLIVHSGTTVDFRALRREGRALLVLIVAVAAMAAGTALAMAAIAGGEVAAASPGPLVGGGAAAAIASVALRRARPAIAAYPWLVFMFQGLLAAPLLACALKRCCRGPGAGAEGAGSPPPRIAPAAGAPSLPAGPCGRVPDRFKGTAYYLAALMLVSVLNRWLWAICFARIGLGMTVTALLFGIVLGRLGLLDREPLAKSDSLGFLMLGLMALMSDALAKTPLPDLVGMSLRALEASAIGLALLAGAGAAAGRALGLGPWRGVAISAGCMSSYPSNLFMLKGMAARDGRLEAAAPGLAAAWLFAANFLSILMSSFVGVFLPR